MAGAAYQVEGAAKDEGRGPSTWDVLSHRVPNFIADNNTADITDNNYYMYKEDIARIAALGVKAYSFSERRISFRNPAAAQADGLHRYFMVSHPAVRTRSGERGGNRSLQRCHQYLRKQSDHPSLPLFTRDGNEC